MLGFLINSAQKELGTKSLWESSVGAKLKQRNEMTKVGWQSGRV